MEQCGESVTALQCKDLLQNKYAQMWWLSIKLRADNQNAERMEDMAKTTEILF